METKTIKGSELNVDNVVVYGEEQLHIDHISEIVGQSKRIIWFDNGTFSSLDHAEDVNVLVTTDGF